MSCQSPTSFLRRGLLCSCGCMRVKARGVRCELTCGKGSAGEADGRALDQSRHRCCRHPRSSSPLFSVKPLSLSPLSPPLPSVKCRACMYLHPLPMHRALQGQLSSVNFLGSNFCLRLGCMLFWCMLFCVLCRLKLRSLPFEEELILTVVRTYGCTGVA